MMNATRAAIAVAATIAFHRILRKSRASLLACREIGTEHLLAAVANSLRNGRASGTSSELALSPQSVDCVGQQLKT
jgi:hypothetical protein